MNRERQESWVAVAEQPIPVDGSTVLVWLAEPLLWSKLTTACFNPNVRCIGSVFSFDAPQALYWMDPPLPPEGEADAES